MELSRAIASAFRLKTCSCEARIRYTAASEAQSESSLQAQDLQLRSSRTYAVEEAPVATNKCSLEAQYLQLRSSYANMLQPRRGFCSSVGLRHATSSSFSCAHNVRFIVYARTQYTDHALHKPSHGCNDEHACKEFLDVALKEKQGTPQQ